MFGKTPPPHNEDSYFHPASPYGSAKLASYWAVRTYRDSYNMFAANGILFNHESPRRGKTFVTRKITRAAAPDRWALTGTSNSATWTPRATGMRLTTVRRLP